MLKQFKIAFWMTIVTTILCGIVYPLAVTGAARALFSKQAGGTMLAANGKVVGSKWIGQSFISPEYFHPRPSAAGNGYDPLASGGSNLGPTNHQLTERIQVDAAKLHEENPSTPIPTDLLTTSGSGLDPEISPEAAYFQVPRIAKARSMSEPELRSLIQKNTIPRQWGFLGEQRVNVLELNLALDTARPKH
ncbi:MAG TPA: potassium-transporting ATPase subunit KdpC [Candidatus Acidoferrum sp.]|nr:potassium-transporting ATPase subunit KdpC [Candidatus Acidoferrum sp.]